MLAAVSRTGTIAWRELMTPDVAAARAFYATLFGWTYVEAPSVGAEHAWIEAGDRRIGAIWKGEPAAWLSFVTVDDLAATVSRTREGGGSVPIGPAPYPGLGTYAVLQDPEGAQLVAVAWDHAPEDDPYPAHGRFAWQTLGVRDIAGATARVASAIGWTSHPGPDGLLLAASGVPLAEVHPQRGPRSRWLAYVSVEDVAATLDRAAQAGARIVAPASPLEGGGAAGVFIDPTGAVLGLLEPA